MHQPRVNGPAKTPGPHFAEAFQGTGPENYEKYFVPVIAAPLAEELVALAAPRPGERVVDVACGTGVVARLAARRVAPAGAVTGIDPHPGMLAVARSLPSPGATVAWKQAGAEALPLPDNSVDLAFCQISAQFFPDKPAAFREMFRVLSPGGRVAVNLPGGIPPLFSILAAALERYVGPPAAGFVRAVFSLHDPDELERLLTGAGFRDVAVRSGERSFTLPPPEEFIWQYIQSTPVGSLMAGVDDASRSRLQQEVVAEWRKFAADGAMTYRQDVLVATGRKS